MTRTRFAGQLTRHTALRKRQQAFLRVLVDCCGSRVRAIEASGTPRGSVFRWQSDPWFRQRYCEVRAVLASDAEAFRDHLGAQAVKIALGRYSGVISESAVRRIVRATEEADARLRAAAQIRAVALLGTPLEPSEG